MVDVASRIDRKSFDMADVYDRWTASIKMRPTIQCMLILLVADNKQQLFLTYNIEKIVLFPIYSN